VATFYCYQGFQLFQLKEKITTLFFQKKTEKRKPISQGRREGMSSFFIKILPGGTEGGDFYKNP